MRHQGGVVKEARCYMDLGVGRVAARGFSPVAATRHSRFGIPVGGFFSRFSIF